MYENPGAATPPFSPADDAHAYCYNFINKYRLHKQYPKANVLFLLFFALLRRFFSLQLSSCFDGCAKLFLSPDTLLCLCHCL